MMATRIPTEQDARRILLVALGKQVRSIDRFPTGLANYVYDVVAADGERLVIRLARPEPDDPFAGTVYWHDRLRTHGVPLPRLHYIEPVAARHGFPVMIMERLAGRDLGAVYPRLSSTRRRRLAEQIVRIQRGVAGLPEANGYGFARSLDDPSLHRRWTDVLSTSLTLIQGRIAAAGVFPADVVVPVESLIRAHQRYFDQVRPTAFLDDTTTKNVIVDDDGRLRGIVDVDHVAFGDPLFTVALTRMSLLAAGEDTDYISYWSEALNLAAEQRRALEIYTALFCVDFMSEAGHAFNKDRPATVEWEMNERLHGILRALVAGAR